MRGQRLPLRAVEQVCMLTGSSLGIRKGGWPARRACAAAQKRQRQVHLGVFNAAAMLSAASTVEQSPPQSPARTPLALTTPAATMVRGAPDRSELRVCTATACQVQLVPQKQPRQSYAGCSVCPTASSRAPPYSPARDSANHCLGAALRLLLPKGLTSVRLARVLPCCRRC